MLPIQPVARLLSPTRNWFFIRIGLPRKKCKVLLGENLRPFVSPRSLLLIFCSTQGSSGILIIIGGDFNVILDPDLDGFGGKPKLKQSAKQIENIFSLHDLVDIWRVRNPETKRFTWRQKTPIIQRRLDFWLVDNDLQDEIDQANIIPSIKSDHSAILLSINRIEEQIHGPSFWKFNAGLLDDKDYVDLINSRFEV